MVAIEKKHQTKARKLYKLCESGKAPSIKVKTDMIDLYNLLYGTTYRNTTNCTSCLSVVFSAIKKLALSDTIKKNK
jgi:hypothetical protein